MPLIFGSFHLEEYLVTPAQKDELGIGAWPSLWEHATAVEATKLEHDRPLIPNLRKQDNQHTPSCIHQHTSSCIHVPTFGVYCRQRHNWWPLGGFGLCTCMGSSGPEAFFWGRGNLVPSTSKAPAKQGLRVPKPCSFKSFQPESTRIWGLWASGCPGIEGSCKEVVGSSSNVCLGLGGTHIPKHQGDLDLP